MSYTHVSPVLWLDDFLGPAAPPPALAMLAFPGVTGNYLSVPDSANLNVPGDIEIVTRVSLTDWTPAANSVIVSKTVGAGNRSWYLMIAAGTGLITFNISVDGTNAVAGASTAPGFTDGKTQWLKVTRVAATGLMSFYSAVDSSTEPTSWTPRGTSTQTAGSLAVSTTSIGIGAQSKGDSPIAGRIRRLIVRNGIGGPAVLNVSEDNANANVPSNFIAGTGQTVIAYTTGSNQIVQPRPPTPAMLVFPGVNGNYLNVPSSTALDIPGDIEVVARIAFTDWSPAATSTILARDTGVTPNRTFWWQLYTSGAMQMAVFFGGGTTSTNTYSSIMGLTDGVTYWLKATFAVATGTFSFYSAADSATEPVSWTARGTAVGTAGTMSPSTQPVQMGSRANGTQSPMLGRLYRMIIRNGIGGTTVLDVNENNANADVPTGFTATTGQTVTATTTAGNTIIQPR